MNKDSTIKSSKDPANHEAEKLIYLFQKAFAAEYNDNDKENLDLEDGIWDIVELIVLKIRNLIQDKSNKERSERLSLFLSS